jgi:hypothetical protein
VARLHSPPRRLLALALVLVLIAAGGLRAERALHHGRFLSTDERAYSILGIAASHGHFTPAGMNDPLHWPPGTPVLLAVARKLSGAGDHTLDPAAAYVVRWLVGMGLVVAVFLLVRLLAGPRPAVVAAAVALYPPLAIITGWRTGHPAQWAILVTVVTVTAVNSFFVSEARHNVRVVPLLVAGGAAGVALGRLSRRGPAERSEPPRVRASEPGPVPAEPRPGAAVVR